MEQKARITSSATFCQAMKFDEWKNSCISNTLPLTVPTWKNWYHFSLPVKNTEKGQKDEQDMYPT